MRAAIVWTLTTLAFAFAAWAFGFASPMASALSGERGSGPPSGYDFELAFAEEFDAPALDPARWGHAFADPGLARVIAPKRTLSSNAERQIFVDPDYLGLGLNPFGVRDGILTITASPLDSRASAAIQRELRSLPGHRDNPVLRKLSYSSGMITQRGRFAQKYGYWEARLRWTGGKGIWPGFWLLSDDSRWPPEIDIMEALGHDPQTIYSSTHSAIAPRDTTRRVKLDGDPSQFHTYGALWLPDRIEYYIDGRRTVTIPASPDMKRPMYALVTFSIGGRWPGDPDASTIMPARLDVDYVKIWKFK